MSFSNLAQALGVTAESLPNAKAESLKYTSLRALDRSMAGTTVPGELHTLAKAAELSAFESLHTQASSPATTVCSFAASAQLALNLASELSGAQYLGIDATKAQQHALHLRVPAKASALLFIHIARESTASALCNRYLHVELGESSRLYCVRLQDAPSKSNLLEQSDFRLQASAQLHLLDINLGAALSRHVLNIELAESDAQLSFATLQMGARTHQDLQLQIQHHAANCRSDMQLRALASERARLVTRGRIYVAAGADQTDANLQSKSMLLSTSAEIDCKPELEIHADEVKAAHGASIGQLDPAALFYLQARGIPKEQARLMLQQAFCEALLERHAAWAGELTECGLGVEQVFHVLNAALSARLRTL
jgi:Fe-S cluster assembly scaffold protein SufB